MKIKKLATTIEKFVKDNAPTILMSLGLVSFGGAIYETAVGTVKSVRDLDSIDTDEPLSKKEIIKLEWKNYVPAAALTVAGTGCVIMANHMNLARIEALATAYALNKDKFKEYQDKVKEVLGEQKEYDIRDRIAQDHVNDDPDCPPWVDPKVLESENGADIWVRDPLTGRKFRSSKIKIDAAVNEFNKWLLADGRADLNAFYDILGLDETKLGRCVIWDMNTGHTPQIMDVDCHYVMDRNGDPMMEVEFKGYNESFLKNPDRF